jgi:hypothetical protein
MTPVSVKVTSTASTALIAADEDGPDGRASATDDFGGAQQSELGNDELEVP